MNLIFYCELILCDWLVPSNSLSSAQCPLGSTRGLCQYKQLLLAINNKLFQCSNWHNSQQLHCSGVQDKQRDLFKFYASSRLASLVSILEYYKVQF